ncbi:MAG TPA: ferritin [Bacteroidales bacterium]|jgi:ferritin|nr:ferritin [Bacteroidales bacterium]
MKLNKTVETILNKQINAEFWSANLYLSMSAWFEKQGLSGMAGWMRAQYHEENSHALKLYDYVIERGGEVKLAAIDAVQTEWKSVLDVFEDTLKHECKVTEMINNCYEVALSEKDHATAIMLHWFIEEQVEEESNVQTILDKIALVGEKSKSLYLLDKELGARQA